MHDKPPMLGEQMRPDREGRFGSFGGRYVPETLIPALTALVEEYEKAASDPQFQVCFAVHFAGVDISIHRFCAPCQRSMLLLSTTGLILLACREHYLFSLVI